MAMLYKSKLVFTEPNYLFDIHWSRLIDNPFLTRSPSIATQENAGWFLFLVGLYRNHRVRQTKLACYLPIPSTVCVVAAPDRSDTHGCSRDVPWNIPQLSTIWRRHAPRHSLIVSLYCHLPCVSLTTRSPSTYATNPPSTLSHLVQTDKNHHSIKKKHISVNMCVTESCLTTSLLSVSTGKMPCFSCVLYVFLSKVLHGEY